MTTAIVAKLPPRVQDLTGQTFGRLTVVKYAGKQGHNHIWHCRCECGVEKLVQAANLKSGGTKSCGCLAHEVWSAANQTHGCTGSLTHTSWCSMKERCYRKNHHAYHNYGGRGIEVCARWKDSFENFLADMGERPSSKHSIEREDNDGNYCPTNCVWKTRKEQARNKRNNRMLTHDGKTQCLAAWVEELEISRYVLRGRLNRGWSVERALTTPVKK